jgi:hypothetical protein
MPAWGKSWGGSWGVSWGKAAAVSGGGGAGGGERSGGWDGVHWEVVTGRERAKKDDRDLVELLQTITGIL